MFVRRLLICLTLLSAGYQSALAAPACEGVDSVLETVSILRGEDFLEGGARYNQTVSRLDETLSQISLATLQPEAFRRAFPNESRALFLYTSNLRRAVSSAQNGYDDVAQEILGSVNPAQISDSLLTLNRYWNCTPIEMTGGAGEALVDEGAMESNQSVSASETGSSGSASVSPGEWPSSEKSNTRTLPKTVSSGPRLNIQGHPFLSIAMALSLIALIYGWRKYSKRSRARDHRHLIHQDTAFQVGKKHYQMTVIDITQRGLKFKHDGLIQRQRKVSIQLDGDWHPCRLVWKNANFAGAKFKGVLSDKTMDAILAAAHQPDTPDTARPA